MLFFWLLFFCPIFFGNYMTCCSIDWCIVFIRNSLSCMLIVWLTRPYNGAVQRSRSRVQSQPRRYHFDGSKKLDTCLLCDFAALNKTSDGPNFCRPLLHSVSHNHIAKRITFIFTYWDCTHKKNPIKAQQTLRHNAGKTSWFEIILLILLVEREEWSVYRSSREPQW